MNHLLENAERGLAYLDEWHPGWAEKVPAGFNIGDGEQCIIAHLTLAKTHDGGIEELGMDHSRSAELGFYVPGFQTDPRSLVEYAVLTTFFQAKRDERLKVTAQNTLFVGETHGSVREEELVGA